jgi:hypothetical protein
MGRRSRVSINNQMKKIDQKYLDDWTERFEGIYVSENMGEGVAPWNIQQWQQENKLKIVFYHFHAFKFYWGFALLGDYKIPGWFLSEYRNYLNVIKVIDARICSISKAYRSSILIPNYKLVIKVLYNSLKGVNNKLRVLWHIF